MNKTVSNNKNNYSKKDYAYIIISDILITAQKLKWIAKSAEDSFYKKSSISKDIFKTIESQITYIEQIGLPIISECKIIFSKKYNIQITYIEQALKLSKRIFNEFNAQKTECSSHYIFNKNRQYA
ncbi:MAG: hypothetical protein JW974_02615 [Alphaproteobacteria bacterium]|nr:hypothetical protein [Alphaproteobacteria bacterium]MBN2675544.1 hypothetical protein [Alphaproteobacteria bacterium]